MTATSSSSLDTLFMARAVALSREHMEKGEGGPFGALVAVGDTVVAEGWNQVTSTNDPTAHAEVVAIRRACTALGRFDLRGATLYTSCEPCPMCLASALWARVGRIVYANTRGDAAAIEFDDAPFYDEVARAPSTTLVAMEHQPSAEARAVFQAWAAKPDKIAY
ncbi:nucleoside deaminase [Phreatobacter stygius]|uniref:Nucleoside deaminase n=1 Tax=Phreatobacter stygius TaxID=1940610 RepID=A0A4D7AY22_9HYPH|nr:nucleoside deaminase [Phreatobacter stygius]QCI65111.1 nucleoside deaminase [Phreatobacter stygius]